jgi:hypothetical protein
VIGKHEEANDIEMWALELKAQLVREMWK